MTHSLVGLASQHRILGEPVLPGMAGVELAAATARNGTASPRFGMRDVKFLRPIKLPHTGNIDLEARVERNGEFRIVTQNVDLKGPEWTTKVTGRWFAETVPPPPAFDLAAVRARCHEALPLDEVYCWYRDLGLDYGPELRVLRHAARGADEVVGCLSLPASETTDGFLFHPALADGALQLLGTLAFDATARDVPLYVPVGINEIRCFETLPSQVWCWGTTQLQTREAVDELIGDLTLCNERGQVIAQLLGVTARRLGRRTPARPIPPAGAIELRRRSWRNSAGETPRKTPQGRWWIFAHDHPLCEEITTGLASRGLEAIRRSADDELPAGDEPAGVLWIEPPNEFSVNASGERIQSRIKRLAAVMQRLARDFASRRFEVQLVTFSAQGDTGKQVQSPDAAALIGLVNSVGIERSSWNCRSVDLDPDDRDPIRAVWEELCRGGNDREVIYRDGIRRVATFDPLPVATDATLPKWLRRRGVFAITGGWGGIGRSVARWLADQYQASVILLVRREPMDEERKFLDEIKQKSPGSGYYLVDITDGSRVGETVDQIVAEHDTLDGVFHCAGVIRDTPLTEKTWADFDAVLSAKITGTLALASALDRLPDAGLVLFSSISGYSGNLGQTDYAAANRFLDAFAQQQAGSRWIQSLIWGPWSEVGMARNLGLLAARLGLPPITPCEGLRTLEAALCQDQPTILTAKLSAGLVPTRIGASLAPEALTAPSAPPMRTGGATIVEAELSGAATAGEFTSEKPSLEQIQQLLCAELASALEVDPAEVGIDVDLQDLGMDSIIAMQMFAALNVSFSETFSPFTLFEQGTVADLSEFLHRTLPAEQLLSFFSNRTSELGIPSDTAFPSRTTKVVDASLAVTPSPEDAPRADLPAIQVLPDPGDTVELKGAPWEKEPAGVFDSLDIPEVFYEQYARPELARRLRALRLNVMFERAEGNRLFYRSDESLRSVLDLVGGFGTTLLGHNHPELRDWVVSLLRGDIALHAQGSRRGGASLAAAALAEALRGETGRDFIVTFFSTGTEAVEAALRHADMEFDHRRRQLIRRIEQEESWGAVGLPAEGSSQADSDLNSSPVTVPSDRLAWRETSALFAGERRCVLDAQPVIVAVRRAFHGRTAAAARASDLEESRTWPADTNVIRIDIDASELSKLFAEHSQTVQWLHRTPGGDVRIVEQTWCRIAAVILEPVQGEGGVQALPGDFLESVRALADQADVPVIVDEIQSGLGRCGSFTAAKRLGFTGDYYTFAKGLGGGLTKISAVCIHRPRYQDQFGQRYTSTFGEDDLSCLTAFKTLEIIRRDDIPGRCARIGDQLLAQLNDVARLYPDVIAEVRGLGCMVGVELRDPCDSQSATLRFAGTRLGLLAAGFLFYECGLRVLPTTSQPLTLRIEPSAYLGTQDIATIASGFQHLCKTIRYANAGRLLQFITGGDRSASLRINDWRGRHPSQVAENVRYDVRAAFVMYFIEVSDMLRWDPSLEEIPAEELEALVAQVGRLSEPAIMTRLPVRSSTGEIVELNLFGLLLTSNVLEGLMHSADRDWVMRQLDEAISAAQAAGCHVVGLGGGLSIVSGNCIALATERMRLTSGNALTVGAGYEACLAACTEAGIDLCKATAAVLGAGGNIGSTYAQLIARCVPRLLLVGRIANQPSLVRVARQLCRWAVESWRKDEPVAGLAASIRESLTAQDLPDDRLPLDEAADRLWQSLAQQPAETAPLRITADLAELRQTQLILAATNTAEPVILPEHVSLEPVVICDVAVPADVADEVLRERPNAWVISGGLVRPPFDEHLPLGVGSLPAGHLFACAAETLVLALERYPHHFAMGAIALEQVDEILAMARKHGFKSSYVRRTWHEVTPDGGPEV